MKDCIRGTRIDRRPFWVLPEIPKGMHRVHQKVGSLRDMFCTRGRVPATETAVNKYRKTYAYEPIRYPR